MHKKLDAIFERAKRVRIDNKNKIVIMSDCHRGVGDNYDNFIKNQNIYKRALIYYYNSGYTYIELGDGDDMWEVKNYNDIMQVHFDTFKYLKKFYEDKRFVMIYGNHDIVKKWPGVLEKYFYKYYNEDTKKEESLFDGLEVYESLVLDYDGRDIFLIHGHQVDLFNSTFWHFSRFLVRYGWRVLEYVGVKDPTSTAKNHLASRNGEIKLRDWSVKNNKIVIAGHTHRPIFPNVGQSLYFNDGSCVHPDGITCLEIEEGRITLVKWGFKVIDGRENLFSIKRIILGGGEPIIRFFRK